MRISLTAEADRALGLIVEQVLKKNPFIEKDNSRLLSAIVVIFHRCVQPRQFEELIYTLTTPEAARLALLREVEGMSKSMNSETLRVLEASIKKFRLQTRINPTLPEGEEEKTTG
jgi:hypothetical protein